MNPSDVNEMLTVIMVGIIVVFGVLILLTASIWLYSKIVRSFTDRPSKKGGASQNPKKAAAIPTAKTNATNVTNMAAADNSDADEIMAVIAAAVYYAGLEDGKTYSVKSINRVAANGRSAWAMAGISQNINSFFNLRRGK